MKRHPVRASSGLSRRSILGRGGVIAAALGLGRGVRHATARAASPEMETHPVVGLWQFIGGEQPTQEPSPGFEIFHADGTYVTWGDLDTGGGVGIWRPTGERTADALWIFKDIDPATGSGNQPGTATFRATIEVDETGSTLTYSNGSIEVRDVSGTVLFSTDDFDVPASTRVTFDHNPMTGSTVTGTPEAGTPAS